MLLSRTVNTQIILCGVLDNGACIPVFIAKGLKFVIERNILIIII